MATAAENPTSLVWPQTRQNKLLLSISVSTIIFSHFPFSFPLASTNLHACFISQNYVPCPQMFIREGTHHFRFAYFASIISAIVQVCYIAASPLHPQPMTRGCHTPRMQVSPHPILSRKTPVFLRSTYVRPSFSTYSISYRT